MKNVAVFVGLLTAFICQIKLCTGRVEYESAENSPGKSGAGCKDCANIVVDLDRVRELIETLQIQFVLLTRKVKRCGSRECGGSHGGMGLEGVRSGLGPYEFQSRSEEEREMFMSSGKNRAGHMANLHNMPKSNLGMNRYDDEDSTKGSVHEIVHNELPRQGNVHKQTPKPHYKSQFELGRGRKRPRFSRYRKGSLPSRSGLDYREDSIQDPLTPKPYRSLKSRARRKMTTTTTTEDTIITDDDTTMTPVAIRIITSSSKPLKPRINPSNQIRKSFKVDKPLRNRKTAQRGEKPQLPDETEFHTSSPKSRVDDQKPQPQTTEQATERTSNEQVQDPVPTKEKETKVGANRVFIGGIDSQAGKLKNRRKAVRYKMEPFHGNVVWNETIDLDSGQVSPDRKQGVTTGLPTPESEKQVLEPLNLTQSSIPPTLEPPGQGKKGKKKKGKKKRKSKYLPNLSSDSLSNEYENAKNQAVIPEYKPGLVSNRLLSRYPDNKGYKLQHMNVNHSSARISESASPEKTGSWEKLKGSNTKVRPGKHAKQHKNNRNDDQSVSPLSGLTDLKTQERKHKTSEIGISTTTTTEHTNQKPAPNATDNLADWRSEPESAKIQKNLGNNATKSYRGTKNTGYQHGLRNNGFNQKEKQDRNQGLTRKAPERQKGNPTNLFSQAIEGSGSGSDSESAERIYTSAKPKKIFVLNSKPPDTSRLRQAAEGEQEWMNSLKGIDATTRTAMSLSDKVYTTTVTSWTTKEEENFLLPQIDSGLLSTFVGI